MQHGTIKELVIRDVSPEETDEEIWEWASQEVLLPAGIPVNPWMRHSMYRTGTDAIILLEIPLDERAERALPN